MSGDARSDVEKVLDGDMSYDDLGTDEERAIVRSSWRDSKQARRERLTDVPRLTEPPDIDAVQAIRDEREDRY